MDAEVDQILRIRFTGYWLPTFDSIQNVFYAKVIDPNPTAGGVATVGNFGAGLYKVYYAAIHSEIVSPKVEFQTVDVDILSPETGFFEAGEVYVIPAAEKAGGAGGEALSPTDAYGIRFNRPNANFRHSYKRFAGVTEDNQSGGNLSSAALASLIVAAATFVGPLPAGELVDDATEALVGTNMVLGGLQQILNGDVLDMPVWYPFASAVASPTVRTQNTRQFGRGS